MTLPLSMQAETDYSFFTEIERNKFKKKEDALISQAKAGNHNAFNLLVDFWDEKKELFKHRAFERSPYAH